MSEKQGLGLFLLLLWGVMPLSAEQISSSRPQSDSSQMVSQVAQTALAPRSSQTSQSSQTQKKTQPKEQPAVSWTDDADFIKQFNDACQMAVDQYTVPDFSQKKEALRQGLKNEVKTLLYQLNRNPDQKNASGWIKYFHLEELQRMLRSDTDDMALLEQVQKSFSPDQQGVDNPLFQKLAEALNAYMTMIQSNSADEDRQAFEETKNIVCEDVAFLLNQGDAERAEAVADSVSYLLELQPNSEPLKTALLLLTRRFAVPNIQLSVDRKVLIPDQAIPFTEPTTIRENIRGTATQGTGKVTGMVRPVLMENPNQAEIQIQIDALLEANSTGFNQGVTVRTTSKSHLIAKKSIFVTDKTTAGPTTVTSSMDTKITGVNTGRGNIGSRIANDRIQQEFPYSKAESKRRAEQRVAERLDKSVNEALGNNGLERTLNFLKKYNCSPRGTASSTTVDRLKWYSLFGQSTQIGPAHNDTTVLNHDLALKIHESAPNNISYALLAGRRISDLEFAQWFDSMRNGSQDQNTVPSVATDTEKPFYITFSMITPLMIQMSDQKITITSRIEEFEQEEKVYPGLIIEIVFKLEQQDGQFCLKRESIEAWPPELERTDSIPARYQAVRTQVLKKLEEGIQPEYKITSIPIKDFSMNPNEEAKGIRGTLVPAEIIIKDGWFLLGADYTASPKPVAKHRVAPLGITKSIVTR